MSDELITFAEEETEKSPKNNNNPPWIIGIIDDEPSVHEVTILALKNVTIYGRELKFVSAYSEKEGFELIKQYPEMAVVLLDVVMETDDAGLQLVEKIRQQLNNSSLQIILRTGQPGYAPEEDIIIRYDINAYKTKGELTRSRLFTSVATSIRSYQHLTALEKSRTGLRKVIQASASLMQERSVYEFSSGVLEQIDALFDLTTQSMFCVSQRPHHGPFAIKSEDNGYYIVAANEKFQPFFGKNIAAVADELPMATQIMQAIEQQKHVYLDNFSFLYLSTPAGWQGVIVAENAATLRQADQEILQIFCMNVALGLESAKYFAHLNKAAFHDELTGLYNRAGLLDVAQRYLYEHAQECSLFILDIDYFHHVVTSMGYEFGDAILKKTAENIKQIFGEKSVVARLHSDVFAVLTYKNHLSANDVALRCSRPILVESQSIRMGMTVGHCNLPYEGNTAVNAESALRKAELALNVAKEKKRGAGETFDASYELESKKSMTLLNELRVGLDNKELFLQLQPKVATDTSEVVGFEGLIRWRTKEGKLIPPGAFIPVVEKSGMNYGFDLYVAEQLCQVLINNPSITVPVSFNISANSLNHETFIYDLKQIFSSHQIDFSRVEIEVTENALINSDNALARLAELKKFGFSICLDDFGAGFSSLSYLLRLPINIIKIDRAFVADITTNPSSYTLIEGIVSIMKNLNKSIVVEGVETQEQLNMLTSLNIETIQGFYFYKPMDVSDAITLLKR
ncbi:two-component system response regulator [Thalassotalea marina]|uniref:Diguanylate cyclase n=1 Tax=Thalassotalea marina TaxID=1673741 RepID=A0A919BPD5_9GAMM|nr:EAL domain-containing protein [Thalassotalea marina]GHG05445.1 diguanylate cyclase [Thalassotalea marina]